MDITLHEIKIRELAEGYQDFSATEEGIVGYGGRLNVLIKLHFTECSPESHERLTVSPARACT